MTELRAEVRVYFGSGVHRHYFGVPGRFDFSRLHWDWRYRIYLGDLTVYDRRGFHSWASAWESLCRNYPKILHTLKGVSDEPVRPERLPT